MAAAAPGVTSALKAKKKEGKGPAVPLLPLDQQNEDLSWKPPSRFLLRSVTNRDVDTAGCQRGWDGMWKAAGARGLGNDGFSHGVCHRTRPSLPTCQTSRASFAFPNGASGEPATVASVRLHLSRVCPLRHPPRSGSPGPQPVKSASPMSSRRPWTRSSPGLRRFSPTSVSRMHG